MKNLIQRNKLNNERGVALILAMMVMVALSLLTINSFELLTSSIRISRNHKDDIQALYVAEAGIEDAILDLRLLWSVSSFTSRNLDGNTYTLTVNTVSAETIYEAGYEAGEYLIIESQGTVGNFQRTLTAMVKQIDTVEFAPLKYSVAVMYWREREM